MWRIILVPGVKKRAAGWASSENVSEMDSRWFWFMHRLFGMCWAWLGRCTPSDLAPVLAFPAPAGWVCANATYNTPIRGGGELQGASREMMNFRPKKSNHKVPQKIILKNQSEWSCFYLVTNHTTVAAVVVVLLFLLRLRNYCYRTRRTHLSNHFL